MRKLCAALVALATLFGCGAGAITLRGSSTQERVYWSASATTIYAFWFSPTAAATTLDCGPNPGVFDHPAADAGTQSSVIKHYAIVAGLAPSTTYHCRAVGDVITYFDAVTNAAPSTTALASVTFGSAAEPVPSQISGDTFYTALGSDGVNYLQADDNLGFGNGTSSNQLFAKLTSTAPITGTNVNVLSNFGTLTQCIGDGGTAPGRASKLTGIYSLGGVIYGFTDRQHTVLCPHSPGSNINTFSSGSIIKDHADHGATWSNFQAPTSYSANGAVPSPNSSLMFTQPSFNISNISAATPNGTVTTTAAHNIIDNTDEKIIVAGVTPSCYNSTYILAASAVTGSNTFKIGDTSACGPYVSGGTVTTDTLMSALSPIMGCPDDGTIEPGPDKCRVDNMDAYVYAVDAAGYTFNGSNLYLARVPRAKLSNLVGTDWQFYVGGVDGSLDGAWSASPINQIPILSSAGKISITTVQYMPASGRYVMMEWYYPSTTVTNNVTWTTYEAAHPWGTWNLIDTHSWTPGGFYNPSILQQSAMDATLGGTPMTLMFSGDYTTCCGAGGFYHLFTAPMTLH